MNAIEETTQYFSLNEEAKELKSIQKACGLFQIQREMTCFLVVACVILEVPFSTVMSVTRDTYNEVRDMMETIVGGSTATMESIQKLREYTKDLTAGNLKSAENVEGVVKIGDLRCVTETKEHVRVSKLGDLYLKIIWEALRPLNIHFLKMTVHGNKYAKTVDEMFGLEVGSGMPAAVVLSLGGMKVSPTKTEGHPVEENDEYQYSTKDRHVKQERGDDNEGRRRRCGKCGKSHGGVCWSKKKSAGRQAKQHVRDEERRCEKCKHYHKAGTQCAKKASGN